MVRLKFGQQSMLSLSDHQALANLQVLAMSPNTDNNPNVVPRLDTGSDTDSDTDPDAYPNPRPTPTRNRNLANL